METILTPEQLRSHGEFRGFAAAHVAPEAAAWDRAQQVSAVALAHLGEAGYLGGCLPKAYGGKDWDAVTFGLLNEALGRADSAFTGLVTVQAMVAMALLKWGTDEQRLRWLPLLARGEVLGAFALTEPQGGSDLAGATTTLARGGSAGGELRLNGEKCWISNGQTAGVFLVFGQCEGRPTACLVPRDSAGLEIEPIRDLLGFRAAGLARLRFRDVAVPAGNLVGKPGFALSHVAAIGLHYGRLSTAWSAAGLVRGCLEESARFAGARRVGAGKAADLGMIQALIAGMGTDGEAARLLCWSACRAEDQRRPEAYTQAFSAKYFASQAAARAAANAVQIQGAAGCQESSPVARYYRAAKIMEIIEGTTQVHAAVLGQEFVRTAGRAT